ncbi:MAG: hypothetical protein WC955_06925 [Elusimicrobiota bacterium]
MIPCTDFIPAYSELFKYLHKRGGKQEVTRFWEYLSDNFLLNLREYVRKHGVYGCWLYWSRTLKEESAGYRIVYDGKKDVFRIVMTKCPSKMRLLNEQKKRRVVPYKNYCMHCDVLYRRVLEPLGLKYTIDLSKSSRAKCGIVVYK